MNSCLRVCFGNPNLSEEHNKIFRTKKRECERTPEGRQHTVVGRPWNWGWGILSHSSLVTWEEDLLFWL